MDFAHGPVSWKEHIVSETRSVPALRWKWPSTYECYSIKPADDVFKTPRLFWIITSAFLFKTGSPELACQCYQLQQMNVPSRLPHTFDKKSWTALVKQNNKHFHSNFDTHRRPFYSPAFVQPSPRAQWLAISWTKKAASRTSLPDYRCFSQSCGGDFKDV